MDRWIGKVAVVTGASSGIGAAISEQLVNLGMKVVGVARRKENIVAQAEQLKGRSGELYAVKVDICKEEDILNAFSWITENVGPIHILINNAGTMYINDLGNGDTSSWKSVFDTNLIGLCIASREAIKIMRANNQWRLHH
ncbi:hypothetical protein RI129_007009 [Pyrocoelia pectoralis]|uniref:Farnesol dehydrogenase n=1 Tax=Pyrocoelia pectoralis TaxID=417401 RepID=A0AAN7VBJ2_9COLE